MWDDDGNFFLVTVLVTFSVSVTRYRSSIFYGEVTRPLVTKVLPFVGNRKISTVFFARVTIVFYPVTRGEFRCHSANSNR